MSRFIAFVYRNAKAYKPGASHVGLGVSALQHVIVLRRMGHACECYSAYEVDDLMATLGGIPQNSIVVIEALWLVTANVRKLLAMFPDMHFLVRCHSQIGFLQVEPQAVQLFREQALFQETDTRFELAGNSRRFTYFVQAVYHANCTYLPNLYDRQRVAVKSQVLQSTRSVRVGCFGALRNLKMHITGAAGALMMARWLGKDLEFHLNVGRDEGGGSVIASIQNLFDGLRWATLVRDPWVDWPSFKRLVATMDVCVQVSASETFNIVTADCFAEGVPCIVGPAIDWAPSLFHANIDDPEDIASKLFSAYTDPRSPQRAAQGLDSYLIGAEAVWTDYLGSFNAAGMPLKTRRT